MKELHAILAATQTLGQTAAALATVVKVQGSAYRRAGARMLISEDGKLTGAISGGCLEGDALKRARLAMIRGHATVVTYDTTDSDDVTHGVQLGCNGVVHVLIEPLSNSTNHNHPLHLLQAFEQSGKSGVLATVFRSENKTVALGGKIFVGESGNVIGSCEDDELFQHLTDDAKNILNERKSNVRVYPLASGDIEVFLEYLEPPVPLVIFGGGYDAFPVIAIAKELGWHVTLVDGRPANASRERFAFADRVVVARAESASELDFFSERTVVLVMTHNYRYDIALLKLLLTSPVQYVGILGPRRRTERMLAELSDVGIRFTDEQFDKLHSPVGLDIGAETPEAIALSMLAEVQAVLTNRSGRFLKDRSLPIHGLPT
jgi:xanthine dehydrogenase accessory factor